MKKDIQVGLKFTRLKLSIRQEPDAEKTVIDYTINSYNSRKT